METLALLDSRQKKKRDNNKLYLWPIMASFSRAFHNFFLYFFFILFLFLYVVLIFVKLLTV